MLIFYVPAQIAGSVDPIVIVDYTRSDDQFSFVEVEKYAKSLGVLANRNKVINPVNPETGFYSLDYSFEYEHNGISYGDALKTRFAARITNAPIKLVGMLNIKQYISSGNIQSLENSLKTVIDPQVFFPTGAFVMKPNSGSNEVIKRTFMVTSTPYNFDPRRISSSLQIGGSEFDSMVMRLKFTVDIDKSIPLMTQLQKVLAEQDFTINFSSDLASLKPVVSKWYEPAPINKVLSEVCRDNYLIHKTDTNSKVITFQSIDPNSTPIPDNVVSLSFNNYVPGSKLISTFSLQNYASCLMECEAFDISLFDTVFVYDDSFTQGQFNNLKKSFNPYPTPKGKIDSYRFYVLQYLLKSSRSSSSISINGTNNWLISNFKLDVFLENKIYTGGL